MRNIILVLILLIGTMKAIACDVCGCAINTSGNEVIPGVFQNYLGMRANVRHFESLHYGLLGGTTRSKEWFHTTEFYGRYSPHRRLQLIGFLPYNAVFKREEDQWHTTNGLGDARLKVNFLLVDHKDSTKDELLSVFLGTTLKVPTGRYDFVDNEAQAFRRSMLPGTGTWDYSISADLIYRRKNIGGILSGAYTNRGTNDLNYDFGNVFSGQASIFYRKQSMERTFLFEAGMMITNLEADYDLRFNEEQVYTSGSMVSPMLKFTSVGENWTFFAMANHALWQNLGKGRVKQYFQFDAGFTYFLPTNKKQKTTNNEI